MSQMSMDTSLLLGTSQPSMDGGGHRQQLTAEEQVLAFKWTEIYKVAYERSSPGSAPGKGLFHQGQLIHQRPSTKITLIDSKGRRLVDTYRRQDEAALQRNGGSRTTVSSDGNDSTERASVGSLKRKRGLDESSDASDNDKVGAWDPWRENPNDYYFPCGARLSLPEGYSVQMIGHVQIFRTLIGLSRDDARTIQTKEEIRAHLDGNISASSDEEDCDEDSLFQLHRKMATSPKPMPTRRLYAPRKMAHLPRDYLASAKHADKTAVRIRPYVENGYKKHHLVMPPPTVSQRMTEKLGKRVRQHRVRIWEKKPKPLKQPMQQFDTFDDCRSLAMQYSSPPLPSSPSPFGFPFNEEDRSHLPLSKRRKLRIVHSSSSVPSTEAHEAEQNIRRGLSAVHLQERRIARRPQTPIVLGQPEKVVGDAFAASLQYQVNTQEYFWNTQQYMHGVQEGKQW